MSPSAPLKTKVSSWKNFLRLFSPKTGRISLVIPTKIPHARGDRAQVCIHLPMGPPLEARAMVVQIVKGPDGTQRGVGLVVSGLTAEQTGRIEQLRQEALASRDAAYATTQPRAS